MDRFTKIIATLGPEGVKYVAELSEYVNGFRFNFSHDTHAEHRKRIEASREFSEEKGIALIADLRGPQIRTTNEDVVEINEGMTFRFNELIGATYPVTDYVNEGDFIFVDEGRIRLRVLKKEGKDVLVRALTGGAVKPRRHVNIPKELPLPTLTEKDLKDLDFIADQGFDVVAQSFVRNARDVKTLREELADRGLDARIIAKIEAFPAIDNLNGILDAADGIMVARGDLGVEMPIEEVPLLQRKMVMQAREMAKPVIVATHMMLSMTRSPFPSRAEASDVAHAVFGGADAVMLSEETSVGDYPVETVQFMDRIIRAAEREAVREVPSAHDAKDIFAEHAIELAESLGCEIIVPTVGGTTPRKVSRYRKRRTIHVFTPNRRTHKFLSLVYGVESHLFEYHPTFENLDRMKELAGVDRAVFLFGYPDGKSGTVALTYY